MARPSTIVTLLLGSALVLSLAACTAPPPPVDSASPQAPAPSAADERADQRADDVPAETRQLTATDPPRRPAEPPAPEAPPEPVGDDPEVAELPATAPATDDAVEPAPDPEPAPAPAPPPVVEAASPPEPTRVVVPRIGVNHPMVPVGLHPDRTLVVPDQAHVAGWYTGAPRPGQTGPSVVVGHNTWKGSQGVFWHLHRLVPGDEVEIHHDDGSVVRFAVERVEQHPKDAFPTRHVYGNTPRQEIRVITCGGVFDRQQRRHLDNIVVFGVLIG